MSETSAASEPVVVARSGAVATVTLNRPAARNAISSALLTHMRRVMTELGADDSVAAVVLTGADPAFCAGLDLKELSAHDGLLGSVEDDGIPAGYPWQPLPKPVIGAVNGVAVTGGLELALNCDFLIASERAQFADTHARVGILPGWGLSVLLPQRVGFAMARRMSFTGDFVGAARALEAGLVTEVVAHEELVPRAQQLAATVAANNRPAVTNLHASYRRIEAEAVGRGLELEQEAGRAWRRGGGTSGISDRVAGVVSRGRSQVSGEGRAG